MAFDFGYKALAIALFGFILASCGAAQIPMGAIGPKQGYAASHVHRATYNYQVIYSFQGGNDGALPGNGATLTAVSGALYGTTENGGGGGGCGNGGCGTMFQVGTSGSESVIYRFQGKPDAQDPDGPVINLNGTWYGVTNYGGSNGYGAVFAIDASGQEHVLYSFKGGSSDGEYPFGQLTGLNGILYGTTSQGGTHGFGTVYTLTPSGSERVLKSFTSYDGNGPYTGLVALNGTLYGTTVGGGKRTFGTVFSITTSGKEKVIYSFKGGKDGAGPQAPLTLVGGEFYGTTSSGGGRSYVGTAFKLTLSGIKTVLHRFQENGIDGYSPQSTLFPLNGKLYGTTSLGGRNGIGIVFSLTKSGKEKILHYFTGPPDGRYPTGGLTVIGNTLYGTTTQGGTGPCYYDRYGCGTVFMLTP